MNISSIGSVQRKGLYTPIKMENQQRVDKQEKRDSATISEGARALFAKDGQTKSNSMIDSLMKQREKLLDRKNSLMDKATAGQGGLSAVKDQLKEIEEQLQTIDDQISQQMLDDRQRKLEGEKSKELKNEGQNEEATESESQMQQFQKMTSITGRVTAMEQLSVQKNSMGRTAHILANEIAIDEARSLSGQPASLKRKQLHQLNKHIEETGKKLYETMQESNRQLKPAAADLAEKPKTHSSEAHGYKKLAADNSDSKQQINRSDVEEQKWVDQIG
ncbi:hypothetical protein [Bacillus sp. 1P06AnD]|uniref:hypothetical protein n=1 Tax=Bacillus sp. 1P06AnD TaxID=3132208 RepID=UPI0039A25A80